MKALIQELSRRFGTLSRVQRALVVGVLAVFALYNAMDFGEALGRALHDLAR